MKIIDAHTHFFPNSQMLPTPQEWAKKHGESHWIMLCADRPDGKRTLQGFPSVEKFISDMDAAGVEMAIIQGWYWQNSESCKEYNRLLRMAVRGFEDRLKICASIQPADVSSALEIIRSARDDGFCGIGELHDGVQHFNYSSEDFSKIALEAAKEELPICLHITGNNERNYPGKIPTANHAALSAARSCPNTKFIFAHWGGEIFFDGNEKLLDSGGNIYFDSAATPLLYPKNPEIWSKAAKIDMGCSLAVYGSDYPIRLYPKKGSVEEMINIVADAKDNFGKSTATSFFYGNAKKLFL